MQVGSKWGTIDGKQFKVTDVKVIDNQQWVYYTNIKTEQNYSCLEEAFKSRFNKIVNNG